MNWSGEEWRSVWKTLERTAMLGTDRMPMPVELKEQLTSWGFSLGEDEADSLLRVLLQYETILRSNGASWDYLDPLPAVVPEGSGQALSGQAIRLMDQVLEGGYPEAMPELLKAFKSKGLELPPAGLPAIFERSLKDAKWWKQIRPLLGARAYWLIGQNPRWAALDPEPDLSDWQRQSPEERLRRFRALRQDDAIAGSIFLQQQWPAQSRQMQQRLLAALAPDLIPEDIPLLARLREGTALDLRAPASRLLVRLPDSDLHRSLLAFLQEHLQFSLGKWNLDLPKALPEELEEPPFLQAEIPFTIGARLSWIAISLRLLDPQLVFSGVDPTEAVVTMSASLDKGECNAVLWALSASAVTYQRSEWARALLQIWVVGDFPDLLHLETFEELCTLLPDEDYQDLARLSLPEWPHTLKNDDPAFFLLTNGNQPWDGYTAKFILQGFQNYLIKTYQISWTMTFYRDLLLAAAFRAPVQVLLDVEPGWPQEATAWGLWEDTVHRVNQTAKFRKALQEALDV
ncbi:MAG: DUF5691 domain-containing protein [Bacteroidota bacterium]